MSKNNHFFYVLIISVSLTLLPILNIIKMINYGDNNLSNDYVNVVSPIAKALDGQLSLKDFISLSWARSHFIPVWMGMTIIIAYLTHWNVYAEMYLGLILMILRLVLLWKLFTQNRTAIQRLLILPILSALVFSPTQASTFTWGGTADAFGLLLFVGTFGIWGLMRFQGRYTGVWIMMISGVIASWIQAPGIVTWPIYFLALLLYNYRKITFYLMWLGGASIALFPYFYFMIIAEAQSITSSGGGYSFLNYEYILQLFGAALTQYKFGMATPLSGDIGAFGVLAFFALIGLRLRKNSPALFYRCIPSILVGLWGVLGAWLISVGRSSIAPWYNTTTMQFWIGLVGFIFITLFEHLDLEKNSFATRFINIYFIFPTVVFIVISVAYVRFNVFEKQYPFYLPSRAPVSAACLRHYKTAPTYCEGTLFQWGIGHVGLLQKMAGQLEEHQLSVFSPHQTWTLQGDYVFETVMVNEEGLPASWWTGLDGEISTWQDYKHLDMLLPAPASISWEVDLSTLESAILETAVGINANNVNSSGSVVFKIGIKPEGEERLVAYQNELLSNSRGWQTVQLDLKEYLGKKITIDFTTQSNDGSGAWAMYHYPIIDIHQDEHLWTYIANIQYEPENTELSGKTYTESDDDFILSGNDKDLWQMVNLGDSSSQIDVWLPKQGEAFLLQTSLNLCLGNYSDLLVEIAVAENVTPRYLTVYLTTDQGMEIVDLPLLQDGEMHSYTYPLRLLELDPYGFLRKIYLDPHASIEAEVHFGGVNLIRDINSDTDCSNYYPGAAIQPEMVVGEITQQNSVSQTFISECKGLLDGLDLYSATYARNNTQPLIVTLTDLTAGSMIWNQSIPAISIENNDWEIMAFDPIRDSYQKEYQIDLQSPTSVMGDAVTIYQGQFDQYALGDLYVSGALSAGGDLVFRYHCSSQQVD